MDTMRLVRFGAMAAMAASAIGLSAGCAGTAQCDNTQEIVQMDNKDFYTDGKLDAAMKETHALEKENRRLRIEEEDIYSSGIWKLQHDAKGPMKVIFGKGNILTFLASVYIALCTELFIFNNAYYSTPRPNSEALVFSPLRFGLVWLGAFVLIAVLNSLIQKGYRRELA